MVLSLPAIVRTGADLAISGIPLEWEDGWPFGESGAGTNSTENPGSAPVAGSCDSCWL